MTRVERQPPAPLVILSPGRSYSTVISAILGQHPDIYALPETCLFARDTMAEYLRDRGAVVFGHGLVRAVRRLLISCYDDDQALSMARSWVLRQGQRSTLEVFDRLRAAIAGSFVIEKSPLYSARLEHLERLRRFFGDTARYIHLVRSPHGYGASLLKTLADFSAAVSAPVVQHAMDDPDSLYFGIRSSGRAELDPQFVWLRRHRLIRSFLATIDPARWRVVRSEIFLRNVPTSVRELCDWLSLPWAPAVDSEVLRPDLWEYSRVENGVRPGGDREFFRNPILRVPPCVPPDITARVTWGEGDRELSPEVQSLARALGYD